MSSVSFQITRALSGSTSFYDGCTSKRLYVLAYAFILTDDSRRIFTLTDTLGKVSRYRLDQVTIYHDGTVQAYAVRLTNQGMPYQNGARLVMVDSSLYGPVVSAMIELAKAALVQLRNDDHASVIDNCCSGTGYADYAAVPCPSGYCPVTLFDPTSSPRKLAFAGPGRVARVTVSVF